MTTFIKPGIWSKRKNIPKISNGELNLDLLIEEVSSSKYKVYSAILNQSGTNAPVAIVLENTIGDIVWSYSTVGNYEGTLTGAFTENKILTFINTTRTNSICTLSRSNNNLVKLAVVITDSVPFQPSNSLLIKTSIEIRVYN